MTERFPEHRFYSLHDLAAMPAVPVFQPGDTITFSKGYPEELVALSRCLEADLQRDTDEAAVRKHQAMLADMDTRFEDLSPEAQDALLPPPFSRLKTDETLLTKRVMHQFKTGIELISAELIAKRIIPIATTTTRDAFGWEVSVVASLKLPGMLQQEDGTFPFIVVRDGRMLRFGPYDMEKQKIDMVNTKTMRESAATARSIAAVALGTASSGGVKPKHISLEI